MLENFFKLDNSPLEFRTVDELTKHFQVSTDLQNVIYYPDTWPQSLSKMKGATFKNVSLSKKKFEKVTFVDCRFEDCLFIGTSFEEVQFHRCTFKNCNFYKAKINKCYWDPITVCFDKVYKESHSNLGVEFFQQLMKNAQQEDQSTHLMNADIEFRRWKRAQLKYEKKEGHLGNWGYYTKFLCSYIYELLCGFGYKPFRFIISTILLFIFISIVNTFFLTSQIEMSGDKTYVMSMFDQIFFAFSMLTSLGFSEALPITKFAKALAMFEVLFGIGWFALFTSILIKRVLK